MESFLTVFQVGGVSKCVCSFWLLKYYFKKYVYIFEHMEIVKTIYDVVVEPSYKKITKSDNNHYGNRRQNRG